MCWFSAKHQPPHALALKMGFFFSKGPGFEVLNSYSFSLSIFSTSIFFSAVLLKRLFFSTSHRQEYLFFSSSILVQELFPLPQMDLLLWIMGQLLSLLPSQLGCPVLGWDSIFWDGTPSSFSAACILDHPISQIFFSLTEKTILFS